MTIKTMICKFCDSELTAIFYNYKSDDYYFKCVCGFKAFADYCGCDFLFIFSRYNYNFELDILNDKIISYEVCKSKPYSFILDQEMLSTEEFSKIFDYKNLEPIIEKLKIIEVFK